MFLLWGLLISFPLVEPHHAFVETPLEGLNILLNGTFPTADQSWGGSMIFIYLELVKLSIALSARGHLSLTGCSVSGNLSCGFSC